MPFAATVLAVLLTSLPTVPAVDAGHNSFSRLSDSGVVAPGTRYGGSAAVAHAPGVWPLLPTHQVVHGFDPPAEPWGPGHRGVDLLGHPGQQVHAALGGTISYAGELAGRGVVVVDHGAERTTYEPVSPGVAVGDQVRMGEVIGTLELPMSHCFPRDCLHWGLIRGSTYLDPLILVGGGPVRLLPLSGLRPGAS